MALINGIGGAFIFSNDPGSLAIWYAEHFGLQFTGDAGPGNFYVMFWALDPDDPSRKLDTTFAILQAEIPLTRQVPEEEPESMYGDQPFMLNLRTNDLDNLLVHLQDKGVQLISRQDESYGRFAWVRDADGNRVELYQPLSGVLPAG